MKWNERRERNVSEKRRKKDERNTRNYTINLSVIRTKCERIEQKKVRGVREGRTLLLLQFFSHFPVVNFIKGNVMDERFPFVNEPQAVLH